jgi:hypothetical protein
MCLEQQPAHQRLPLGHASELSVSHQGTVPGAGQKAVQHWPTLEDPLRLSPLPGRRALVSAVRPDDHTQPPSIGPIPIHRGMKDATKQMHANGSWGCTGESYLLCMFLDQAAEYLGRCGKFGPQHGLWYPAQGCGKNCPHGCANLQQSDPADSESFLLEKVPPPYTLTMIGENASKGLTA